MSSNQSNPPPGVPSSQQQQQQHGASEGYRAPGQNSTEPWLPTGQDRSEQLEYMQSYEMNKPQTEDDKSQEQLAREFPNIDSSLIAAIWSDNKDLGAAREMLQHLSST
jgi:hypothetical protein